jgi:hypothetical protein
MPLVGFDPTIPVFKRAKTFPALDRAATVTGYRISDYLINNLLSLNSKYVICFFCIEAVSQLHDIIMYSGLERAGKAVWSYSVFRFGGLSHPQVPLLRYCNLPILAFKRNGEAVPVLN